MTSTGRNSRTDGGPRSSIPARALAVALVAVGVASQLTLPTRPFLIPIVIGLGLATVGLLVGVPVAVLLAPYPSIWRPGLVIVLLLLGSAVLFSAPGPAVAPGVDWDELAVEYHGVAVVHADSVVVDETLLLAADLADRELVRLKNLRHDPAWPVTADELILSPAAGSGWVAAGTRDGAAVYHRTRGFPADPGSLVTTPVEIDVSPGLLAVTVGGRPETYSARMLARGSSTLRVTAPPGHLIGSPAADPDGAPVLVPVDDSGKASVLVRPEFLRGPAGQRVVDAVEWRPLNWLLAAIAVVVGWFIAPAARRTAAATIRAARSRSAPEGT
ncbi:hypothetical protein F4553_002504 [Allocatelliglobosispora scoriae]|uniref:Uncharacterized protein n=1 Tax=Allocatelliglobosispora scoriae TaxID=643052 RepID=A0A841BN74_9ACTN|nr:hypothetical protein [Allocatelliglobosispora scoriae]MBB5869125.1 hypothetical protein [Allocatelliglobosispora scoriae]